MRGDTLLDELAICHGIDLEYYDIWGKLHRVGDETKRAILGAMGIQTATPEELEGELKAVRDGEWLRVCDPVLVVRKETSKVWSFRLPIEEPDQAALRLRWEVRDEAGQLRHKGETGPGAVPVDSRTIDGRRYVRLELPIPSDLPFGYYDLAAYALTPSRFVDGAVRLIIVPDRCHLPGPIETGERAWGLALQLYALKSARNWGVGDFTDLAALVEWAAADLKAGIIGLNPLHALRNERPYHISPYSPDSRLYLNYLYVDVEALAESQDCAEAIRAIRGAEFQRSLESLRTADHVRYEDVSVAKLRALNVCFQDFWAKHMVESSELQWATSRGQAFVRFVVQEGEPLEGFALFHALSEMMRTERPNCHTWQEWPEAYRDPASPAVAAFRISHERRVRFFQYVQWVASEQLLMAADRTKAHAMSIGLYHDLALGSERSGADAWMSQDVYALGADCGCPPDAFAPQGQNWGLPPVNPRRLRDTGYRMFVQLLRNTLRYGGAVRLDHVMGLFRLFWIPRGMPAAAGAYVRYPVEDLLGILALESVRLQVLVIGEDLGTVPDEVRERLGRARILSYRVLYFERWGDGSWKRPEAYPEQALAVVTTHDLPTLNGFWIGQDIEVRARLGGFPNEAGQREAWERRLQDKVRIWEALRLEGLLPAGVPDHAAAVAHMTTELCLAIHTYLARTPSWAVLAALDDLMGEVEQTNLPGTVEAHPNWSRKLSIALEDLIQDPRPKRLAALLAGRRSSIGS